MTTTGPRRSTARRWNMKTPGAVLDSSTAPEVFAQPRSVRLGRA
ncbi:MULTISPECIES: hypothetical protein [unclassified Streptomyces]|nr:hypothetical protein [Streptomyces sp. JV176]MEE1798441.1 hypothetical protein [Streptomyces sp. JV176]